MHKTFRVENKGNISFLQERRFSLKNLLITKNIKFVVETYYSLTKAFNSKSEPIIYILLVIFPFFKIF